MSTLGVPWSTPGVPRGCPIEYPIEYILIPIDYSISSTLSSTPLDASPKCLPVIAALGLPRTCATAVAHAPPRPSIPRAEPPQSFGVNQIVHGDRSIIVIEQGAQKQTTQKQRPWALAARRGRRDLRMGRAVS